MTSFNGAESCIPYEEPGIIVQQDKSSVVVLSHLLIASLKLLFKGLTKLINKFEISSRNTLEMKTFLVNIPKMLFSTSKGISKDITLSLSN